MKIKPRDAQIEALEAIQKVRKAGITKGLVSMATGLGKTCLVAFDAYDFFKQNGKGKLLFVAHQEEILRQAEREFHRVFDSGYTMGQYHSGEKNRNANFLFATFQTLNSRLDNFKPNEFDYVVIDEAHHGRADTYRPVVEHFKPKFKIGITATPKRMDGRKILESYSNVIIYEFGVEEAIVAGYLCPIAYALFTDDVNWDQFKVIHADEEYTKKDLNIALFMHKRDKNIGKEFCKAISGVKDPRTIIFCPSIKYVNKISKQFKNSVVLHSGIAKKLRKKAIKGFREGHYRTILTIDMFNEGVDIPGANIIVFLRSTQSQTIFLQQLGRGLRKYKNKRGVLILDFVANVERMIMWEELKRNIRLKAGKKSKKAKADYFCSLNVEFEKQHIRISEVLAAIKKTRPDGYWTLENTKKHLLELCRELGRFPTHTDLQSRGDEGLIYAIMKYGGLHDMALEMGYKPTKRKANYWMDREAIAKDLLPICKKLGKFPTEAYLTSLGRRDLVNAIKKLGGFPDMARDLGYKTTTKPHGYWNRENTKKALLPICKKLGKFPGDAYLQSIGRHDLRSAIHRNGGARDLAKELGFPIYDLSTGHWKVWENIVVELRPICKELGYFPDLKYLEKIGKKSLVNAICRYWGGKKGVAERMGYKLKRIRPVSYWSDKTNIKKELKEVIEKLGHFPTHIELGGMGTGKLYQVMGKHGGIRCIAREMGYVFIPGRYEKKSKPK